MSPYVHFAVTDERNDGVVEYDIGDNVAGGVGGKANCKMTGP